MPSLFFTFRDESAVTAKNYAPCNLALYGIIIKRGRACYLFHLIQLCVGGDGLKDSCISLPYHRLHYLRLNLWYQPGLKISYKKYVLTALRQCQRTAAAHLHTFKSFLLHFYPERHSREKRYQTLTHFREGLGARLALLYKFAYSLSL